METNSRPQRTLIYKGLSLPLSPLIEMILSKSGPRHLLSNWPPNLQFLASPVLNREIFLRHLPANVSSFPKTCPVASCSFRGSSQPLSRHLRVVATSQPPTLEGHCLYSSHAREDLLCAPALFTFSVPHHFFFFLTWAPCTKMS